MFNYVCLIEHSKLSIDASFRHHYHMIMYKQKQINTKELELFGRKVFEETTETVTVFPRKFKNKEESQPVLAETAIITRKLFGIPIMKAKCSYDSDRFLSS